MTFDEALEVVLKHEGGFSDHAADPGGKTRFGITEAVAREHGYAGDMRELPLELAKQIYRRAYWDKASCDALPPQIRLFVFDHAVNAGVPRAVRTLQTAVGTTVDGVIGPKTLMACNSMPALRLVARLSALRLEHLAGLSTWPAFSRGWVRRVAANLLEV